MSSVSVKLNYLLLYYSSSGIDSSGIGIGIGNSGIGIGIGNSKRKNKTVGYITRYEWS